MLPPTIIDPRLSNRELLTALMQERQKVIARVNALQRVINDPESARQLMDLRAWAIANETAINLLIHDRKKKMEASQILSETRLRIERGIGAWLELNVSRGGDRRPMSHGATSTARGTWPVDLRSKPCRRRRSGGNDGRTGQSQRCNHSVNPLSSILYPLHARGAASTRSRRSRRRSTTCRRSSGRVCRRAC